MLASGSALRAIMNRKLKADGGEHVVNRTRQFIKLASAEVVDESGRSRKLLTADNTYFVQTTTPYELLGHAGILRVNPTIDPDASVRFIGPEDPAEAWQIKVTPSARVDLSKVEHFLELYIAE